MKYLGKHKVFDDLMIGGVLLTPPNPASYAYELTLPNDDGTSGQVLTTDGNGVLTWTTNASGSGTVTSITPAADSGVGSAITTTGNIAVRGGSNVTTSVTGTTITVNATDTNTTYSAGDGLDLSGTTFSTDLKSNGGLVIESTELAVDLGASSITGILAVEDGGTGLSTVGTNHILTGNGTSALTAEDDLRFWSDTLSIGSSSDSSIDNIIRNSAATDIDGGSLKIVAGDARPGVGNNRIGGDLNLYGGLSTGNAASGKINIYTGWEGVAGTAQLGAAVHSTFLSTAVKNELTIYEPNSLTADFFRIVVAPSGATTITTVDAAAHAADLTFNVDGNAEIAADSVTLDSAGDIELEVGAVTNYVDTDGLYRGGNIGDIQYVGSVYYIPITATDFQGQSDARGNCLWGMEGISGGEWASHGRQPGYIEKVIPLGFTATSCVIYGDTGTNTFQPFESSLDASTVTSRGSATAVGSTCTFTSNVVGDGNKTVSIKLIVGDATDFFFGGKLMLIKT